MALRTNAFAGKSSIVTGGASGIGRALGAELLAHGAHVVLADVEAEGAERAAEELSGEHPRSSGSVVGVGLDVRDGEAVQALVDEVADRHGGLDLVFNNAGISLGGPTHEMTAAHWERILDVNLRGVIHGVLAAYPLMVRQGRGHIVNTASMAGLAPTVYSAPYATTKHAVVGLSTSLRPEAAAHGVRVSVLCPGAVETPILDRAAPPDLPARPSPPISPRDYLAAVRMAPAPVERFARDVLGDVARNRAVIIRPRQARAGWYLQRLAPAAMLALNRVVARRVDRVAAPPAG